MSCDGYHTTVEPADLPFQGSSMRAVQCKLGRYGSHLEHQSSYIPHVPHAPLTDTPPLMPPTLLLTLFVLLYLHTAPHPAARTLCFTSSPKALYARACAPHGVDTPLTDAPPHAPCTPRTLIPPTQWLSPCSWSAIQRFFTSFTIVVMRIPMDCS